VARLSESTTAYAPAPLVLLVRQQTVICLGPGSCSRDVRVDTDALRVQHNMCSVHVESMLSMLPTTSPQPAHTEVHAIGASAAAVPDWHRGSSTQQQLLSVLAKDPDLNSLPLVWWLQSVRGWNFQKSGRPKHGGKWRLAAEQLMRHECRSAGTAPSLPSMCWQALLLLPSLQAATSPEHNC
jgi:hypothetical protein